VLDNARQQELLALIASYYYGVYWYRYLDAVFMLRSRRTHLAVGMCPVLAQNNELVFIRLLEDSREALLKRGHAN
jgi:hypothetical protein